MAEKLSFADAAEEILREYGKPMHYREIIKIVLDKGLVSTGGQTPEATLSAVIG